MMKSIDTNIDNWLLYSVLGREILSKERQFYSNNIDKLFGIYSLQIGLPEINVFQGNKIVNHYHIGVDIFCSGRYLPFTDNSIDLIIMPHYLEQHNDYKYVLNEVTRILTPNGVLIISCFNSQSLLNLRRKSQRRLDKVNFINLSELKSNLINNKLSIIGGKFFSYCPPFHKASRLKKYNFLNKIGDRWLPTFANSYALICRKNVTNINSIKLKPNLRNINPDLRTVNKCQNN